LDTKSIKSIIDIFEKSTVHKMEVEAGEIKIKLEKENSHIPSSIPVKEEKINISSGNENIRHIENAEDKTENKEGKWIKSPLVGTFYLRPNETSKEYVNVGDRVNKGDVVCIIEAMKVMNEIKAPCDGKVLEVAKSDGEMVQFNDNLICIGD